MNDKNEDYLLETNCRKKCTVFDEKCFNVSFPFSYHRSDVDCTRPSHF